MHASLPSPRSVPRRYSGTPIVEPFQPASKNAGGAIAVFCFFMGLLTLLFVVLKLTHVVAWSWYGVFAPQLALIGFLAALALGVSMAAARSRSDQPGRFASQGRRYAEMPQLSRLVLTLPHSMQWDQAFPDYNIERVQADTSGHHVIIDDRGQAYRMPPDETAGELTSMFRAVGKTTPGSFTFVTHHEGNGYEILIGCDHVDRMRAALVGSPV